MSCDSHILWNLYMQICDVPFEVSLEICDKCFGKNCEIQLCYTYRYVTVVNNNVMILINK